MKDRIAIVEGIRTPMCKAGGSLSSVGADDLAVEVVKHLLRHVPVLEDHIDELVAGNVAQPPHAANIARVIALKSGLKNQI